MVGDTILTACGRGTVLAGSTEKRCIWPEISITWLGQGGGKRGIGCELSFEVSICGRMGVG